MEITGVNKKEVGFPGVIKKSNHLEFPKGLWRLTLEIPMGVTQFCGVSDVKLYFVWNIQGLSDKFKNFRGLSQNTLFSTPLILLAR